MKECCCRIAVMDLLLGAELPPEKKRRSVSLLEGARLRKLRLGLLCFTDFIDERFLREHGYGLSNSPPVVARYGLLFVILDGNHRCAYDLVVKQELRIKCAVWPPEGPDPVVVKSESRLFDEVIELGIEAAVRAHQRVVGKPSGLEPGRVVFRYPSGRGCK